MSKSYGILSGKGGVGKTMITANLGVGLADLGVKTLVVDADVAMGNLEIYLGLEKIPITLHELLAGEREFKRAIYQASKGVNVLPSGSSLHGFLRSDPNLLKGIISKLADEYEIILIDNPAGLSKYNLAPMQIVDEVLLIVTSDIPSVAAALKMKTVAGLLGVRVGGIIVNREGKEKSIGGAEIARKLGSKVLATIPEDKNVQKALGLKKPVLAYKPRSKASKVLKALALELKKPVEEARKAEKEAKEAKKKKGRG